MIDSDNMIMVDGVLNQLYPRDKIGKLTYNDISSSVNKDKYDKIIPDNSNLSYGFTSKFLLKLIKLAPKTDIGYLAQPILELPDYVNLGIIPIE